MTYLNSKTVIAAIAIAGLLVGLTASASAGTGGPDATAAAGKKKKKKTCPAGTTKKVVKKKNGKKKVTCVPTPAPTPVTPAPLGATLSITPTDFNFGGVNQGGLDQCVAPPDADCPTKDFIVSNAGPGSSGLPVPSITNITTDGGGNGGFQVFGNTCLGPLAPGASCIVTVRAGDDANFTYQARLNVTASPGNTVSATMEVS